jgi:hypothetical protein
MVLITSLALAAGMQVVPDCSWDRPGLNRYTGDLVASVDHYADLPAGTRDKLKRRLANPSSYDDQVLIKRDSIEGAAQYGASIESMHFGDNQVCRNVTRASWKATDTQRGLVYCEDGHCLIVPSVCGNLGRVARLSPPGGPAGDGPKVAGGSPPPAEFVLPTEPTGAGIPPGAGQPDVVGSSTSSSGTSAYAGDSFTAKSAEPSLMSLTPPAAVTTGGFSPGVRVAVQLPPVAAVPEVPSSALLLAGVGALAWSRRRHSHHRPGRRSGLQPSANRVGHFGAGG